MAHKQIKLFTDHSQVIDLTQSAESGISIQMYILDKHGDLETAVDLTYQEVKQLALELTRWADDLDTEAEMRLLATGISECKIFTRDSRSTSATICVCGRQQREH